jgi:hypothetical protein
MKKSLVHGTGAARHDKKRTAVKQVLNRLVLLLGCGVCLTSVRAQTPSPEEILNQVRLTQAQQQLDLQGQLRSGATVIPFRLTQTGPIIRYTFANSPEVLQLKLGAKSSQLELVTNTSTKKFAASRLEEKIGGTGVTYGDLALRFLYWPNPQMTGPDTIRTRACWKLRLHPPSHDSPYSTVILWVDQESGAIMRLEAYNWQSQLVKRFEVVSAQKIEGRWFLKQMRIEELQPGTDKVQSRSYFEIKR